jgi:Tfp pilus assembly protein PilZ
VWYEEENQRETFLTHTENVGIGGVCVICHQRLKMFSPVSLEIDLLDMEEHVRCKGKIMWVVQRKDMDPGKPTSFDIGVEFQDIKDDDQRRVSKIVQRLGKYQENIT